MLDGGVRGREGNWKLAARSLNPVVLSYSGVGLCFACDVARFLFDSPSILLTSLSMLCPYNKEGWGLSYFGGKLAAMEAYRSYSHPATLDSDAADLDVALAGFGLPLPLAGFDASRAKVVGLKSHLRYTIKEGWFRLRTFFRKTNRSCLCRNCFDPAIKK